MARLARVSLGHGFACLPLGQVAGSPRVGALGRVFGVNKIILLMQRRRSLGAKSLINEKSFAPIIFFNNEAGVAGLRGHLKAHAALFYWREAEAEKARLFVFCKGDKK